MDWTPIIAVEPALPPAQRCFACGDTARRMIVAGVAVGNGTTSTTIVLCEVHLSILVRCIEAGAGT